MHWQAPPGMAGSCHYGEGLLSRPKERGQGWRLVPSAEGSQPSVVLADATKERNADGLYLRKV